MAKKKVKKEEENQDPNDLGTDSKNLEPTENTDDPKTDEIKTVEPIPTARKYIGLAYKNGLFITKINRTVDPRKMTAKQIDHLIKEYEPAAAWFK